MPQNPPSAAESPFYIDQIECVACGACEAVAPDLVDHETDPASSGTYFFKRQPETPGEIDRAIQAINGCCVACIYYRGDNPAIRRQISSDFATPTCCSHPRPIFESSATSPRHRRFPIGPALTFAGLALVAIPFCLAVFATHMTANYARVLYVVFLFGILLFGAGRRLF